MGFRTVAILASAILQGALLLGAAEHIRGSNTANIPDLPEVSANTTTNVTGTITNMSTTDAAPRLCYTMNEVCWMDSDCCSSRCAATFTCAPE